MLKFTVPQQVLKIPQKVIYSHKNFSLGTRSGLPPGRRRPLDLYRFGMREEVRISRRPQGSPDREPGTLK